MRKVLSLFLVICMVFSMYAVVFADDSHMTEIKYVGEGVSEWELDVPKTMAPGETGVVELSGTWSTEEKVVVSAPDKVTLTNELDEDTKELTVTFGSLEVVGNNTESILETKNISVSEISDALFGTWKGYIVYNVKVEEVREIIPIGGTYYVGVTEGYTEFEGASKGYKYDTATAVYTEGDYFPEEINIGDIYVYEDYQYRYGCSWFEGDGGLWYKNSSQDGWGVLTLDKDKSIYSDILDVLNNKPIVALDYTYAGCTNMVVAPIIDENIRNMEGTFSRCTSLTGEIEINANNLKNYIECFTYTGKPIVLAGSCPVLSEIAAEYDNVTVKE